MQTPPAFRMMSRDGSLVRVSLQKPLGIQLEEIKAGLPGVRVAGLVAGGTAKENGLDVPAGVTQEEGHTGFFIHLPSAKISASMLLVELGGRDVTGATFDDVMETLITAPAGVPIDLVFRDPSAPPPVSTQPAPSKKACEIRVVGADGGAIAWVKAKTGDNLRNVLLANKVDVYDIVGKMTNCNGGGQCGTCVVQVGGTDGWDDRSDWEAKKLKGRPQSQRLACQTVVQGNAVVTTKPPKKA